MSAKDKPVTWSNDHYKIAGTGTRFIARLVELEQRNIADLQKLDELQLIYADFDYPEDMEGCSIYSSGNESPLASMNKLINALQRKYRAK